MMISKKLKKTSYPCVIYDNTGLIISKEWNGEYTFEFGKFISCDVVEAVSYLMRKDKNNSDIWTIELDTINKNISCAMYMLSGDDEFWKNSNNNLNWLDCYTDMLNYFEKDIKKLYELKNLGDIRKQINKKFNFSVFYEYFLKKGLISN